MDTIAILKMIFYTSSIISLLIAIALFLSNVVGLVERFRRWTISLLENAIKHGRTGEGVLSWFFLLIYRFRDAIVIGLFIIGIISTIIFSYLKICFTEPYVTYDLFITAMLSLFGTMLFIYTSVHGDAKEINKELRDIREAVGWIKGHISKKE
jgi:hypothetical protein